LSGAILALAAQAIVRIVMVLIKPVDLMVVEILVVLVMEDKPVAEVSAFVFLTALAVIVVTMVVVVTLVESVLPLKLALMANVLELPLLTALVEFVDPIEMVVVVEVANLVKDVEGVIVNVSIVVRKEIVEMLFNLMEQTLHSALLNHAELVHLVFNATTIFVLLWFHVPLL